MRVGLISDTHGLLRPEALDALSGCEAIVHAGDIGDAAVLAALESVAPVTAARGNNDHGRWAEALPHATTLAAAGALVFVIHDVHEIGRLAPGVRAVVSGHSHRPSIAERDGVLFVNPGSAGPRRFTLPVSVGELLVMGERVRANLIELDVAKPRSDRRRQTR